AADLDQSRSLDGLDVTPEVSVIVSEIAVPTPSRPGFELHGQRAIIGYLMTRSELLEQRLERRLERRLDPDFFGDPQREIVRGCHGQNHVLLLGVASPLRAG